MEVVSSGPLRLAQFRWILSGGAPAITVVCKATYQLRPIESPLVAEQEAPIEEDSYWNDDPEKSLTVASDLVPFKKQPEVVLVGHAFAPAGQARARSLVARLLVGSVNKAIEVYGERAFALDGQLEEGAPFQKMRLSYERAAGAPDSTNPVGMRFDVRDALGKIRVPNLQPPGSFVARWGDTFAPIGFGPLAPHWPERRARLYHLAAAFADRGWTQRPFPEGIDAGYFNVAPLDQRLEVLHPNERLSLEGLHPEHPRLVTSLPGIEPQGVLERPGQPPQKVLLVCDTLWIDTDRQICHLVWRGTVPLTRADEPGRIVITVSGGASAKSHESAAATTIAPLVSVQAPTLPFAPASAEPSRAPAPRRGGPDVALPFQDPNDPSARPALPAPLYFPAEGPADGTMFLLPASGPAQPPGPSASAPLPAPPPPPAAAPLVAHPAPPELVIGPAIAGSAWAGSAPSAPPPAEQRGSIGERLAAEQAMAESKAALDKKVRGEPESLGPIQPPAPAEPVPKAVDEAGARRGWKVAGSTKNAVAGSAPSDIAKGGALAASNAVLAPDERPVARPVAVAEPRPRQAPREILELLWYDPAFLPRIRRKPEWKDILAVARTRTFDDDPPPDAPPERRQEARDRKEVFTLLARGTPTDVLGLEEAIEGAVSEDGCFVPPLVLVAGELTFLFDEVETLKATIAAVTPLVGEDKRLQSVVDTAQKLLATPWIAGASELAETHTARIREAFAQGNRSVPATYLEHHTARMLLHQRAYQKRTVFGDEHLRAELAMGGRGVPVYLPESMSRHLPGLRSCAVKLVAEGRRKADWRDAAEMTLRAGAVVHRAKSAG